MGFKWIAPYRARTLLAAGSIGILMGASFGAAYVGARMAKEAQGRNQVVRLMQLSATGKAVEPDGAALSQTEPSQSATDNDQDISEAAMALAIRYAPDETVARVNTALAQNIAYTRISGDQRALNGPKSHKSMLLSDGQAIEATPQKAVMGRPLTAAPLVLKGRTQSDLDCLATAIYYEARGEGQDGMRAVAQVILNRVRHPAFPKTICGVVYQGARLRTGCQFSFTCGGAMMQGPKGWVWDRSKAVAEAALNGQVYRPVGTATHFHTRNVNPVWASRLIRVATVGNHTFYQFAGRGAQIMTAADTVRPSDSPESLSGDVLTAPTPEALSQDQVMNEVMAPAAPAVTEDPKPALVEASVQDTKSQTIAARTAQAMP